MTLATPQICPLSGRNLAAFSEARDRLAGSDMSSTSFLDKPPRLLGAGSYNDMFVVKFAGRIMVLRLSYYSSYTLGRIQALIRQRLPYPELVSRSRRVTALDPVSVKNNYSRFCNHLIEAQVCPHFVYMFGFKDIKCFAALVKDQIKPERLRNNLAFRYNNVSLHEKFQASLRLRLRQLSDLQQRVVVFQVLFALAVMQHYLPGFRHNDLSLDNILISTRAAPATQTYIRYSLPSTGAEFWVPDVGVFTAVADFDLAHAPASARLAGHRSFSLQNQLIAKDQFGSHADEQARNINAKPNRSFDTYYFLYRLKEALCGRSATRAGGPQGALGGWLQRQAIAKGNKYLSVELPLMVPSVLLGNQELFGEFKKRPNPATQHVAAVFGPRPLGMQIQLDSQPSGAIASSSTGTPPAPSSRNKATMQALIGAIAARK